MKRSSVVSLVSKVVSSHLDYQGLTMSQLELDALSEDVVSSLEGLGVLPPQRLIMDKITVGSSIYIGSIKEEKDWEPE